MEAAMEYFTRQMKQQLTMWEKSTIETFSSEDVLDKMCKTHMDAVLASIAYSLAIIADSLKVASEFKEE